MPGERNMATSNPAAMSDRSHNKTLGWPIPATSRFHASHRAAATSPNLGRRRTIDVFRRRGCRCYVLLDEVPKGGREQEGGQLRAPIVQDQFLHGCDGARFRRGAAGKSPA